MNLKFWKHRHSAEVISEDCYKKLPLSHQSYYKSTTEEPTHRVEEDSNGGFLSSLIASEIMSAESFDNTPSTDYGSSSDSNSSSNDFGGGDGGGGGASGDF